MTLRTIPKDELAKILEEHAKWLLYEGGQRADLRGSDLSGSNLSCSNLRDSNLSGSNLSGSNLRGSNLSGSDLSGSNLSCSNLSYSDLSYSDLSGSNLSCSNLSYSDLSYSDLSYSDLSYSNLSGSNLRGSTLRGAIGLDPFRWLIAPQIGAFRAFKKLRSGTVLVEVPASAQRVNAPGSRKIRVSEFNIIELVSGDDSDLRSHYDESVRYTVGQTFKPDSFDASPFVECSHGLHIFLTKEEAEEFSL